MILFLLHFFFKCIVIIKVQTLVMIHFFSLKVIQPYDWLSLNFHFIIDKWIKAKVKCLRIYLIILIIVSVAHLSLRPSFSSQIFLSVIIMFDINVCLICSTFKRYTSVVEFPYFRRELIIIISLTIL